MSAPATWVVTVAPDRAYFALVAAREGPDAAAVAFPDELGAREVVLAGDEVRIGRAPAPVPLEIDLAGPPLDPGVSRLHAVLVRGLDGGWSVVDPGSTNGTTVNDDDEPIPVDRAMPLGPGDRVHVGAWTTLTLAARG